MHPARRWPVAAVLVVCVGCGAPALPKQQTYPVTGTLLLDGKPLANATLVFRPSDKDKSNFKWEELPQGTTDAAGKFVLFTYAAGDGAPAADYVIGIEVAQPPQDDDGADQVKRAKGGAAAAGQVRQPEDLRPDRQGGGQDQRVAAVPTHQQVAACLSFFFIRGVSCVRVVGSGSRSSSCWW